MITLAGIYALYNLRVDAIYDLFDIRVITIFVMLPSDLLR
jgi:hypothetical protein